MTCPQCLLVEMLVKQVTEGKITFYCKNCGREEVNKNEDKGE